MSRREIESRDLVAELADRAERQRTAGAPAPVDPDELLDSLEGRLPPEAEERLQRRLAADPEAARALLDLAELSEAERGAGRSAPDAATDLAVAAGWRDLTARLAAGRRRPRSPWALAAAALLVVSAGLGWRVWDLEQRRLPPVGLATLELAGPLRAPEPPTATLAPGQPLRLVIEPGGDCETYDAELAGPAAGGRAAIPGLRTDPLGRLDVLLPEPAPGSYTLRLGGCGAGEPEGFSFRIVRAPPDGSGGDGR